MNPSTEPNLAPPGAGIPLIPRLVARYLLLPRAFRGSWDQANALYAKQLSKISALVEATPAPQRTQKALIPRLRGLEDSSRFWSIQMTLEHLNIVGGEVGAGIVMLSRGEVPDKKADTALVKPLGQESFEATWEKFKAMRDHQIQEINREVKDRQSPATFSHPWFGPFTAHKWNWLLGIHAGIHLQQLREIRKRLPA